MRGGLKVLSGKEVIDILAGLGFVTSRSRPSLNSKRMRGHHRRAPLPGGIWNRRSLTETCHERRENPGAERRIPHHDDRRPGDDEHQLGVAVGVTFAFRNFTALYPGGIKSFVEQRASVQENFINILHLSANDARKNPAAVNLLGRNLGYEMAIGIKLVNMYFTALLPLSHNERRPDAVYEMVDRLSDQLTPLNERGRVLLGTT
jgi:hypothetical protein